MYLYENTNYSTCIHLFCHNNDVVQHRNLQRKELKAANAFLNSLKKIESSEIYGDLAILICFLIV